MTTGCWQHGIIDEDEYTDVEEGEDDDAVSARDSEQLFLKAINKPGIKYRLQHAIEAIQFQIQRYLDPSLLKEYSLDDEEEWEVEGPDRLYDEAREDANEALKNKTIQDTLKEDPLELLVLSNCKPITNILPLQLKHINTVTTTTIINVDVNSKVTTSKSKITSDEFEAIYGDGQKRSVKLLPTVNDVEENIDSNDQAPAVPPQLPNSNSVLSILIPTCNDFEENIHNNDQAPVLTPHPPNSNSVLSILIPTCNDFEENIDNNDQAPVLTPYLPTSRSVLPIEKPNCNEFKDNIDNSFQALVLPSESTHSSNFLPIEKPNCNEFKGKIDNSFQALVLPSESTHSSNFLPIENPNCNEFKGKIEDNLPCHAKKPKFSDKSIWSIVKPTFSYKIDDNIAQPAQKPQFSNSKIWSTVKKPPSKRPYHVIEAKIDDNCQSPVANPQFSNSSIWSSSIRQKKKPTSMFASCGPIVIKKSGISESRKCQDVSNKNNSKETIPKPKFSKSSIWEVGCKRGRIQWSSNNASTVNKQK